MRGNPNKIIPIQLPKPKITADNQKFVTYFLALHISFDLVVILVAHPGCQSTSTKVVLTNQITCVRSKSRKKQLKST